MALELGELVGLIRADDTGWVAGLNSAGLRLRGLRRDAEGQLRDLRGRFISEGEAAGRGLGDGIRANAEAAAGAVKKVGGAVGALGAGVPAVAAVATAMGGLMAGAAAAGLAVKAFSLAAKPQMDAVAEASAAAEKAETAHDVATRKKAAAQALAAKGGDDYKRALGEAKTAALAAKDADAALEQQMKGLPAATQATAKAMAGLKDAHKEWSDDLAGDTMPVYTKGLNLLRSLLPQLTPFVKAAAGAFGEFLDEVSAGVKGTRFKEWADDMAAASGGALSNFLQVIKNLGVGFAGLLQAFLPASAGVTGGLASMTAAFARWGSSLAGSSGMNQFLAMAREGAQLLGTLAGSALYVLQTFAPLLGVTLQLAVGLAQIVNALPPGVVNALGVAIAVVVIGMKAWALYGAIVSGATKVWAAAQWLLNSAFLANPITWIIIGIVALIAAIVLIATKTTWFQTAWQYVWNAVKAAVEWGVRAAITAINWLSQLPGKIKGWFETANRWVIIKLAEMVVWARGLPGRIIGALAALGGRLAASARTHFESFKTAAAAKAVSFVAWVRGIPGRIVSAIGSLKNLLYDKGADIVRGLLSGVRSMGGWLKSQLIGFAKSMIPGPIAKALGISSPSKLMARQVGRWIPAGIVKGVDSGRPALDRTMAGLVSTPTPGQYGFNRAAGMAGAASGRRGGQPVVIRFDGSRGNELDRFLMDRMREQVRKVGGVSVAFTGRGA